MVVRAAEPEEMLWATLAFDGHAMTGNGAAARRAVEEWRAVRARPDDPLPAALASRLERAQRELARLPRAVPALDAANLEGVGTLFVGRQALLDQLTAMAERARRGVAGRVLLSGASGVGKSRLLDEFESRLRLRGARVARVRLLSAMREVPFAALADATRVLAALPGALGVSESSAAALVDFLPELRESYAHGGASIDAGDRVRRRIEAFRDLLGAVSDNRFVALIVDDAQHLDARSRQAIEQLAALREARSFVLLASRPPVALEPSAVTVLEVPAFGMMEVRALLSSATPWPALPWADALLANLVQRTGGLPQRVIDVVRAAEASGLLVRGDAGWSTPEPERLVERIGGLRDVGEMLAALPGAARRLLEVLRVWGRPMLEETVLGVAARLDPTVPEEAWRDALRSLESQGLLVAGWNTWSIVHDSVAEAVDERFSGTARGAALEAIVRHLLASESLTPALLDQVALLCGQMDALLLLCEAVTELTRRESWRQHRLGARPFCRQVAAAAGHPEWELPLYHRLGWVARQSRTGLAWLAALGATLLLVLGTVTVLAWPRLVVEVKPMGEDLGPLISGDIDGERVLVFHVQPRVSVRNAFGTQYRGFTGGVRVMPLYGHALGDSVAPLVDGMAQFRELGLEYPSIADVPPEHLVPRLRLIGPGIVWGSRTIAVRGAQVGAPTSFRIIRTVIDGAVVPVDAAATVTAGDSIRVELTFEYTTTGPTANYVVAAGPSWDQSPGATIRIAGLPRPVQGAWQTVRFVLPPAPAGHGHLVIAFGAEDSADHLMSATNWAVGPPVWGDGNDLVGISEAEVQSLRRTGLLVVPRYLYGAYAGRLAQIKFGANTLPGVNPVEPAYGPFTIRGSAIEFDVRPRSTSVR